MDLAVIHKINAQSESIASPENIVPAVYDHKQFKCLLKAYTK